VIATSVIGIAVAFLIIRYEFPWRNLSYLAMLPMILPPLVGVLGFVSSRPRRTVNVLLMTGSAGDADQLHVRMQGVLLVETLHLFPFMTPASSTRFPRWIPRRGSRAGHGANAGGDSGT